MQNDFSNSQETGKNVQEIGGWGIWKSKFSWKKGMRMKKTLDMHFSTKWCCSCIPILRMLDLWFERKQSNIYNFSKISACNQTSFWEFNMDFSLFQGELPIAIVQEHEVSSNVIGYREYGKTWVPIVGKTLQCQMEPKKFCR